jgi:predicted transcriptional regulator
MSTIELKNLLIQRISEIQDRSFLEAIRTILDSKAESKTIQLTTEITNEIMASKKEINNGLFVENDSLEKEVSAWLDEK